jgi:serine/threonine protein kinase
MARKNAKDHRLERQVPGDLLYLTGGRLRPQSKGLAMAGETWRDEPSLPPAQTEPAASSSATTWRTDGGQNSSTNPGEHGADRHTGSILRLPSALGALWKIVRELDTRGAEADLLIVENSAAEQRVAKIYRAGIQPKTDVLQQLGGTSFEHVVQLFAYGRSDGRSYELLEYVQGGPLEDLIGKEGPKLDEIRIGQIVVELLKAIQHLHANGVVHRDLKPSNILVRSMEPFDLVITDFGIASMLGASSRRFTTGHRTIAYASPESAAGEVSKASDWWSLGIMLVEMLTGQHPFASSVPNELLDERTIMSRLAQMPVDQLVEGIDDPWRTLCRGLLRREAKNRWTDTEIVRWVRRDPTILIAEEASPSTQHSVQFYFAGDRYTSLPEIAHAFGSNWPEARKTIERGHLLNWVKDDLKDNEWRQFLADLDRDCPDLDERVFRVIAKLDPRAVPVLCGYRLDPEGLRTLANDALAEKEEAVATLQLVFDRGILGTAADSTGVSQFRELQTALTSIASDFRRLCDSISRAGAPSSAVPSAHNLPRATVLLTLLPEGDAQVRSLQERANEMASPDARDCPWFRELAAATNSTAALLIIPSVARAAEQRTRERRQQEDLASRQRYYDDAYRIYSIASGWSVGALGGFVFGFIPCWIFSGLVAWNGGAEAGWKWFTILMIVFMTAGIYVGHHVSFEKRWVESADRDSIEARNTGLLYAIPSLLVLGLLILWTVSPPKNDTTHAQEQQRVSQLQQESQRLASFATNALVGTAIDSNGQVTGVGTTLRGPKTPVVGFFTYQNGRVGTDTVTLTLVQPGSRVPCNPIRLQYISGNVYCKWDGVSPGSYSIEFSLNSQLVRTAYFSVLSN